VYDRGQHRAPPPRCGLSWAPAANHGALFDFAAEGCQLGHLLRWYRPATVLIRCPTISRCRESRRPVASPRIPGVCANQKAAANPAPRTRTSGSTINGIGSHTKPTPGLVITIIAVGRLEETAIRCFAQPIDNRLPPTADFDLGGVGGPSARYMSPLAPRKNRRTPRQRRNQMAGEPRRARAPA